MQGYLQTLGRRLLRWGFGAGITILFFIGAAVVGLPQWAILVAGVIGAILGSVLAEPLMQRLAGPEPEPQKTAPRGRGSGRRGS
jgi:hypothetical protein